MRMCRDRQTSYGKRTALRHRKLLPDFNIDKIQISQGNLARMGFLAAQKKNPLRQVPQRVLSDG